MGPFCVYFFTHFFAAVATAAVRSLVPFVRKFLEFLQFMSVKIISHKSQSNVEKGNLIEVDFIMIRLGQLEVERDKCIKNYISLNCTIPSIFSPSSVFRNCNSSFEWRRQYLSINSFVDNKKVELKTFLGSCLF